jgi:hypothetical protein
VTDQRPPDDRELADQIQRAMAHYRFQGRAIEPAARRGLLPIASLLGAAVVGAVVTLAVIGALGGLPRANVGGETPLPMSTATGRPSSTVPSASAAATPQATSAGILPVTDAEATAACLAVAPSDVLADWLMPGESRAEVAVQFGRLPLLIADRREGASMFVFADDRFVSACGFTAGQEQPSSTMRGVRQLSPNAGVDVLFISSSPMIVDEDGQMVPGGEPEIVAVGTAASEIARVAVVLEDGTLLDARLSGGAWLAWWTEPLSGTAVRAFDPDRDRIYQVPAELKVRIFPESGVEVSAPPDPSPTP